MAREDKDDAAAHEAAEPTVVKRAEELLDAVRAEVIAHARTPLSTYRVQLHSGFRFTDAAALVPYWARLGVSDLYCSPYLKALPGSSHGYDVVDHQAINPEIGTPEEHDALCRALWTADMGQLLDVVPNHMGIEQQNPLWQDVLENGPASLRAKFFDVDWDPVKVELKNKVLLPILGEQYGAALESGELVLEREGGAFFVRYFGHRLPVCPRAYGQILRPRLPELEQQLGSLNTLFIEFQSILNAVEHLPPSTAIEVYRRIERDREKEVIKRRLAAVLAGSEIARAHVDENVQRFNGTPGDPRSFDRLDTLLESCSYRLAHWRVAGEEINYRRFFDINGLAAVRVEDPEVFEEAHGLVFRWVRDRKVTGLRVDHPDGLFDPTAYFLDLQERYALAVARRLLSEQHVDSREWPALEAALRSRFRAELEQDPDSPLRRGLYVVLEKIQGGRERIPDAWAVHGTVGYRFANAVTGLFVDRTHARLMTEIYERFIGQRVDYPQLVYEKKKLILSISMSSEVNVLARELNRISELNRHTRDFTLNVLRRALIEFIALFPVYRTYVDGSRPELDARDVQYIEWTIARAQQKDLTTNASVFDFLRDLLLGRYSPNTSEAARAVMLRFAMKVQQLTGPAMAKGLEDTVFYLYHRLISLNEVGGEPERFGTSIDLFHLRNQERAEKWPGAMLATSTHDTKRSEDVRARINVLSELPDVWAEHVARWAEGNLRFKTWAGDELAPSRNDEYLFYQSLLGAWPMDDSPAALETFRPRLREYMLKAIKEAKLHTSWVNPSGAYDEATARFVDRVLDFSENSAFLEEARAFKRRIQLHGQLNSLGQVLLKLVSPGIADLYQGCELWDLSLVDPDNRRPVDYGLRQTWLTELDAAPDRVALCRALTASMDDGRIKLFTVAQALRLRRRARAMFASGAYLPLDVEGANAAHAVALGRIQGERGLVALVPLHTVGLLEAGSLAQAFVDDRLRLPEIFAEASFIDVFSGQKVLLERDERGAFLRIGPLLELFPVVLLEKR